MGLLWLVLMAGGPVPIVENGFEPTGSPLVLTFEEDLRIDAESDEEYGIWPGALASFAVDQKGRMLVADDRANHIVVFDPRGAFQRLIGNRGQGPGEFTSLSGIQVLADGRILAIEAMNRFALTFFDSDGNFLERIEPSTPGGPNSFQTNPAGTMSAVNYVTTDPARGIMTKHFAIWDKDLTPRLAISEVDVMIFNANRATEGLFWSEFIGDQLKNDARGLGGFAAFDRDGKIWTAIGHTYEVTLWDETATRKLRIIKRNYKPIIQEEEEIYAFVDPIKSHLEAQLPASLSSLITPGVLQKAIELAEFPPGKPPIYGLVSMGDGRLLVIREVNRLTRLTTGDVFDKQGRFQGAITMPNGAMPDLQFRNGYAYTFERDEDEERALVRYRVR